VNGFDQIRDQKRCQEMILKQVAHLSPATFKESSELVHFVSSNAIPVMQGGGPGPGGSGGSGSGGFSSDDNGKQPAGNDDGDDSDSGKHGEPGSPPKGKGKGKQKEQQQDFDELEASLRRFVLEKRARSKLAPAKTYLMNVLGDLSTLASVNKDVAQNEYDRVTKELQALEPVFEKSKKARSQADDDVVTQIESTGQEVYDLTRGTLNSSIAHVAENDLGVEYPGIFGAYNYADDLKVAMLDHITETVRWCEARGREKTVQGVSGIKQLGILHLGDSYTDLTFRSEKMFRSKRDALVRQVDFEAEILDFFDFTSMWERQEKVASTSMAVTVAGVVGTRMVGGVGWLDGALTATKLMGSNNMRRLILPGLLLTGKSTATLIIWKTILTIRSQPSSESATPSLKSHTPSPAAYQPSFPLSWPPSTTPIPTPRAFRPKSAARSSTLQTSYAKGCNETWKTCRNSARKPLKCRTRVKWRGSSSAT
jgi:mitofusin